MVDVNKLSKASWLSLLRVYIYFYLFLLGCMKLGSVLPSLLRDFGQHTLHVEGVKLHLFTTVECTLKGKTVSWYELY